ncbi:MAG: CocE/NonD family hydrolase [Myxococcota bacterium]
MKRFVFVSAGVLFLLLGGALWQRHEVFRRAAGLPAFTASGSVDTVVDVPMRDGVTLHTEIYLPENVAKAPTVLVRNPYEMLKPVEKLQCQTLTRYGYACVLQDVRGQMDSGGEWHPIVNEHDDGLDTLAWLVKQPFVDGNIAMRGPSYLTCTQWAIADALPPEVKTLVPSVFGTDLRKVFYERGLFRHDILTAWATLMPTRGMRHFAGNDYLEASKFRPPLEADEKFMQARVDWYRDALRAADPADPYWQSAQMQQFRAMPEKTKVPMLLVGAFFDPFFMAQLDTWERLATRDQSVFVIGPWNHLGLTSGDVDFSAAPGRLDQWPIMLEWFEHTLKGRPLTTLEPGTVQTFGIGDTGYVTHATWPPDVATTRLELGEGAAASTCDGGVLSATGAAPSEVSYPFDPANPVPTRGGAALLSFAFFRTLGITPGPLEQGDSCARDDVLTFRGAPTTGPQRLSGSAHLTLRVKSTAPDTAFVARLIAEQDGKALLVREDAATLAWPTSSPTREPPLPPGAERELQIDFWPIEWVLPAGGRWRVDVTSSSFPALHVHSNRAGPWETQSGADVATQTLLLGEGRAVLELPLTAP